jgi:hypothetical protein
MELTDSSRGRLDEGSVWAGLPALAEQAQQEAVGRWRPVARCVIWTTTTNCLLWRPEYGKEIDRRVTRPLRLVGTEMPRTSTRIHGPHPHGDAPAQQDGEGVQLLDFTG